jgi:hypothetical protein
VHGQFGISCTSTCPQRLHTIRRDREFIARSSGKLPTSMFSLCPHWLELQRRSRQPCHRMWPKVLGANFPVLGTDMVVSLHHQYSLDNVRARSPRLKGFPPRLLFRPSRLAGRGLGPSAGRRIRRDGGSRCYDRSAGVKCARRCLDRIAQAKSQTFWRIGIGKRCGYPDGIVSRDVCDGVVATFQRVKGGTSGGAA